jgi:hypothetical protein
MSGLSSNTVKLPRPPANPNERAEVEAFMLGFGMALKAINGGAAIPQDVFNVAAALARELYPDFEPALTNNTTIFKVSK